MEQLIEDLTRGNVTEVKVVLATVILALAVYQVLLAAVAYGWLKLPFLESHSASWTHRASGDAILLLTVIVAVMCISFYGFEEGGAHALVACVSAGDEGAGRPPRRAPRAPAADHWRLHPVRLHDHLADLGRRLPWGVGMKRPPQAIQMLGSALFALAIVAVAIVVVTAHFGPTSSAELEAREERLEQRMELREEALERSEEREEERRR